MDEIEFKKTEATSKTNGQSQVSIDFSIKVVEALASKAKGSLKKVSVSQLKKVYVKGAYNRELDERSTGEWAMARVNMFLRLISSNTFKNAFNKKSSISFSSFEIDVTENWSPSEEDFTQAVADVIQFKLDYDFKDVEELYLNDNPAGLSFEV